MRFVVSGEDLGTPEAAWLADPCLARLERWEPGAPAHAVVVAPHPDDEVLGAGGLLRLLSARGCAIDVVAVTDGEGSHPASPSTAPRRLAATRLRESSEAMRRLGVGVRRRLRLRIGDGGVGAGEAAVAECVGSLGGPATMVVAPWAGEGHPDHDAAGRAAARAAREVGADLVEYLVWAWHWATPAGGIPLRRAVRLDLHRRDRAAKRWSTCAYRSQIRPLGAHRGDEAVLPPAVLRRAWRPFEVFLRAGTEGG